MDTGSCTGHFAHRPARRHGNARRRPYEINDQRMLRHSRSAPVGNTGVPPLGAAGMLCSGQLKRVAIFQIRSLRFRSLFLRMSLSQNRCTLLRDMR